MEDKEKEVAPEVPVQEQLNSIYPTNIKIQVPIQSLNYWNDTELRLSGDGIVLDLKIDSNLYSKKDVYEQVNLACQKLLEYFC